jgi:sialidase-1
MNKILCFVLVFCAVSFTVAAEDTVFVKSGQPVGVYPLGVWAEHENSQLGHGDGTAFLYANRKIGDGDFRVTARIMLEELNGSAAAICFNNNTTRFGFDGANKQFFAESPLFERVFGDTVTHFSKIGNLIEAGKPFDVTVARTEETLTVTIAGQEIFKYDIGKKSLGLFALRPHRAKMHVYDFAAAGSLLPLTAGETQYLASNELPSVLDMNFPPEVTHQILFRQGKHFDGYNHIRIPVICATKKGTLLAFAEGRVAGDADKIEIILRRSEDKGKTWGSIEVVWTEGEETCGNPCPVLDQETGTVWLFATWNKGVDIESKNHGRNKQFTANSLRYEIGR